MFLCRDELLREKKHTFWHVCLIKTQLGLCIYVVWLVFIVYMKKTTSLVIQIVPCEESDQSAWVRSECTFGQKVHVWDCGSYIFVEKWECVHNYWWKEVSRSVGLQINVKYSF